MTHSWFGAILSKLTHLRQQTDFSEPTTGFGRSLKDIDNFIVQRFCNVQNLITNIVKMIVVRETKYNSQIQSNSSATRLEWVKILPCLRLIVRTGHKPARRDADHKSGSRRTGNIPFYQRVWSWLRMNAGGVPNTCKSSEKSLYWSFGWCERWKAADGWVTRR